MAQIDNDKDLQLILSQFSPSYQPQSFETIETGHINQTYRVTGSESGIEKHYLLQNLNTTVFTRPEAVTHNIVQCSTFLNNECPDYPYEILMPVAIRESDQYLIRDGKNAWRLFDFIENSKSLDQVTTSHEALMIGEAFGVFLAHINRDNPKNYRVTIPDFHNFTKRYHGFKNFLATGPKKYDDQVNYLISAIDQYADQYLELEELTFPSRIIHHDTKANNVLLDKDSGYPKCIIDLDTLMPGDIFSDFGDLMRTVFNPYAEDKFPANGDLVAYDIISSLIMGFLNPLKQMLTNDEKTYLIKGGKKITLLQVLRFLEDHLKGDIYYQTGYAGQNLDRALS